MGTTDDEMGLADLPSEDAPDYFDILVGNCIKAFAITFSDSTALDANGVIGKQRFLIMDNDKYQKATRMLRARRTMSDLSEISRLTEEVSFVEDDEEEEEPPPPEPTFDEDFDIRSKGKGKRKEKIIPVPVEKKQKLPKRFDKSKIEMRLKLFQHRRDILSEEHGEEEREGDSLNIFFIPVTREEFEKLKTVEVSEGTSAASAAFDPNEEDELKKRIGKTKGDNDTLPEGGGYHFEEKDGERILVED